MSALLTYFLVRVDFNLSLGHILIETQSETALHVVGFDEFQENAPEIRLQGE